MPRLSSYFAYLLGGDLPTASGPGNEQVTDLLLQLLPVGAARMYGLRRRAGDVYNLYAGVSDSLKAFWYDAISVLRQEINPATASFKLQDYEEALGFAATSGPTDVASRRLRIISKLREQGAFTVANIQAILAPLLGYTDASQLEIIEANRAALTAKHTYSNATGLSVPPFSTVTQQVWVADDGGCSDAGARLRINLTAADMTLLGVALTSGDRGTGPLGTVATDWGQPIPQSASGSDYDLFTPQVHDIAGAKITGWWTLTVTNYAGSFATLNSWSVFAEGGGHRDAAGNSGLGMQMHDWFVQFQAVKSSSTPDVASAESAIERIKPAESDGALITVETSTCDTSLVGPFICGA